MHPGNLVTQKSVHFSIESIRPSQAANFAEIRLVDTLGGHKSASWTNLMSELPLKLKLTTNHKNYVPDFEVTAFLRKPQKVPNEVKKSIQLVIGDVRNADQVAHALEGQDVVISCLGTGFNLGELCYL